MSYHLRFGFGGDNDAARIVVGKVNDFTSAAESDSFMAFYTDRNGAATEAMRISDNGNVGIGTTAPTVTLDVVSSAIAAKLTRTTASAWSQPFGVLQLGLKGGTPAINGGPSLLFFGDDSAANQEFIGRITGIWEDPANTAEKGGLTFSVRENAADTTANTERMRITAGGNVGIGTTSPQERLQLGTAWAFRDGSVHKAIINNAYYDGANWRYLTTNPVSQIQMTNSTGEISILNSPSGTSGGIATMTSRMVIDGTGNVGIGLSSPVGLLDVGKTMVSSSADYQMGRFSLLVDPSVNSAFGYTGVLASVDHISSNSVSAMFGSWSRSINSGSGTVVNGFGSLHRSINSGTGIMNFAYGALATSTNSSTGQIGLSVGIVGEANSSGAGTITEANAGRFSVLRTAGTITTGSGVYIGAVEATTPYSLYASDANAPSYFAGRVGIGTLSPSAPIDVTAAVSASVGIPTVARIGGSVTGTGVPVHGLNVSPTLVSNVSNSALVNITGNFSPTGSSGGYGIIAVPNYTNSASTVAGGYGVIARVDTASDFTGTLTTAAGFVAGAPILNGANKISNLYMFQASNVTSAGTSNSGNTSGTINNYSFFAGPHAAAAGVGGTLNNYGQYINLSNGSGASGTTNNYGLFITGNSTGGDTNYAVYSESTALSYLAGNVGIGTTSATKALDVNSNGIRVRTARTPASATAACDQGEISWDANYIYVCRATNTWMRAALSTW